MDADTDVKRINDIFSEKMRLQYQGYYIRIEKNVQRARYGFPIIFYHNVENLSIFLLVMVFLNWWAPRFKAGMAQASSTNALLDTEME